MAGGDRIETVLLADGTAAELIGRDGGWILEVDGIRQSHILAEGDERPALAVSRWLLAALGPTPRRVLHLGGGLLTLPRAVAALTPDAVQVVVELDPTLVGLVAERFGLPGGVVVEEGDARAWLDAGGSPAWAGSRWDAVVVDVFAGGRIPAPFTSRECFDAARGLLADGGLLLVNSVAGGDLVFTRREIATVRDVFAHVGLVVQNSSLHGLRFGNAVLVGSDAPLDAERIRAALRGDPSKGALVTDLDDLVGDTAPVTDADALWSPVPDLPDAGPALRMLEQTGALGSMLRDADGG